MPDKKNTRQDTGAAEDTRPTPSQAEGEDHPGKGQIERPRSFQAEGEDKRRP